MTSSGNKRRPRSGAPERPDLKEKAEKIHAEIFGRPDEGPAPVPPATWRARILAGFSLAAACGVIGQVLNYEYLLVFSLSLAIGLVVMIFLRLYSSRRKK